MKGFFAWLGNGWWYAEIDAFSRYPESVSHECGTGLNGAHCALCDVDYCTVCGGHNHGR